MLILCISKRYWGYCSCRYSASKSFLYGFVATFFPIFDVPVFWPILLVYFLVLLFITLKRQIRHMIKHKYLPFDIGKKVTLFLANDTYELSCLKSSKTKIVRRFANLCHVGISVLSTDLIFTAFDDTDVELVGEESELIKRRSHLVQFSVHFSQKGKLNTAERHVSVRRFQTWLSFP